MRGVPIDFVVDVVNRWSPTVRAVAGDDSTSPTLAELCRAHGVAMGPAMTEQAIAQVAEEIHGVFAAEGGRGARITELARLLDSIDARPALDVDGQGWIVDDAQWLNATMLFGLFDYSRSTPKLARLGTCRAHRCVDAFVDNTQAATRRFCSTTCQTRAKAASRRQRNRP